MMKLSAINDCSILVVSPQKSIIMGPFINYVGGGGDKRMGGVQIFEGGVGGGCKKITNYSHINYIHKINLVIVKIN